MYAVPNSGSDLALIAKVYEHTQIEQLAKSSDFIEFLNQGDNISNLLKYVDNAWRDKKTKEIARGIFRC